MEGFDAMLISNKDAELSFLRQQVELLKQELQCECLLSQVYREELEEKELELRAVESELSSLLTLQMLKIEQAKELANNIVRNKLSVSESLAQLLTVLYNSNVELDEATHTDE